MERGLLVVDQLVHFVGTFNEANATRVGINPVFFQLAPSKVGIL